jgi:hypothetical protein
MRPKIKFSHPYQKLLNSHNDVIETARLLQVGFVRLETCTPEFIEYDTDGGKYKLPKEGEYIILIFEKPHESYTSDRNLFTTLRRYTHRKYEYYQNLIGKTFDVVLVNE